MIEYNECSGGLRVPAQYVIWEMSKVAREKNDAVRCMVGGANAIEVIVRPENDPTAIVKLWQAARFHNSGVKLVQIVPPESTSAPQAQ